MCLVKAHIEFPHTSTCDLATNIYRRNACRTRNTRRRMENAARGNTIHRVKACRRPKWKPWSRPLDISPHDIATIDRHKEIELLTRTRHIFGGGDQRNTTATACAFVLSPHDFVTTTCCGDISETVRGELGGERSALPRPINVVHERAL